MKIDKYKNIKKMAFTLAEIIIVMGVIGVVAALTLPTLIKNIQNKARNSRINNIQRKLNQGLDKLRLTDEINNYSSTEDFVKALSKHMKIICINTDPTKCFPTEKITYGANKAEILVSTITSPDKLGLENSQNQEWSTPVSFMTGDGTSYIISLNTKCTVDDNDGRSDPSGCIAGVYDWNGPKGPNQFGAIQGNAPDILALNSAGFGAFKIKGVEVIGTAFLANRALNCFDVQSELELPSCYYTDDYWAGAVDTCKSKGGRLPTKKEYHDIARYLINDDSCMKSFWQCENVKFDEDRLAALNLPVDKLSYIYSNNTSDENQNVTEGTYINCLSVNVPTNTVSDTYATCPRNYKSGNRYALCVK